jgi:hypothetical protein
MYAGGSNSCDILVHDVVSVRPAAFNLSLFATQSENAASQVFV